MSHVSTPWTLLAARVARGLLSRKGFTLRHLTERFSALGFDDTERGIDGKIARGTYSFAFFLQLLKATRSEYPSRWAPTVALDIRFEEQAAYIFVNELASHGIDSSDFVKRLATVGTNLAEKEIGEKISQGTFPFVLLLQLAAVIDIAGLERFVDSCDIADAAIVAAHQHS